MHTRWLYHDHLSVSLNIFTQQEKFRKRLKVKLEMAKFLQDTIEETSIEVKADRSRASEFYAFINKVGVQLMSKDGVKIL